MISQYPAWSVGRSNLQAVTGKTCGLAEDVLVELDPEAGMLPPVSAPVADALGPDCQKRLRPTEFPLMSPPTR
ncbi:mycobacterial cell wall arabinan synthesis family protein [Mycobacterium kansasii]|uniref:Mycobacterial cell wall arabinan synthesis family protein n=1 Tax=Mycobacterium kansasii TaxID=1768 RepID=A0A1V3X9Q1_MYCKA|nr:mycobacterial cell wall arabinan synthesis family protein [Mycobacterium kansasii]